MIEITVSVRITGKYPWNEKK